MSKKSWCIWPLPILVLILIIAQLRMSSASNFCSLCANKCSSGPNYHHWIISEKLMAPDNFLQKVKVINGQFPGPTVEINSFSHLVVKVDNKLEVDLAIHWHGIHQRHTIESDGVGGVTQYNIRPNSTFTYCIWIGQQSGTYMYHAHTYFDIIWVHGTLIVKDEMYFKNFLKISNSNEEWELRRPSILDHDRHAYKYFYHDERTIILGEIQHTPVEEMYKIVTEIGVPTPIPPNADSLAINGRSYGIWENSSNTEGEGYSIIPIVGGLTYRFRIINLSADLFLRFSIRNHTFRLIEMDGIYTHPIPVDRLDIHTGQRYSVLIDMDQEVENYWMESKHILFPGPRNGLAILHYLGAADPTHLRTEVRNGTADLIPLDEWVVDQLYPNPEVAQESVYPVPEVVDREFVINYQGRIVPSPTNPTNSLIKFFLNGHMFMEPEVPYLDKVRQGLNISEMDPLIFEVLEGEGIQLIFQNTALHVSPSICTAHPWHLHGRFFYVVASGEGQFKDEDRKKIDLIVMESKGKFQFRDVFTQYPKPGMRVTDGELKIGDPCGWYAVRFRANNNGIWLNHCHITSHMLEGKMFLFWEHTVDNPQLCGE